MAEDNYLDTGIMTQVNGVTPRGKHDLKAALAKQAAENNGPRLILAVTVCISYSDRLRHIIENRKHFDRWVVVTVPDDIATQRLCKSKKLEVCVVEECEGGVGFNAALNKSRYINEGIRHLVSSIDVTHARVDAWIALIDADVLLPSDFLTRLLHLMSLLEKRVLYGLAGRRVANALSEFNFLRGNEPWSYNLECDAGVIGYFNLFSLRGPFVRYPSPSAENNISDDRRFAALFGPENTAKLPISCLHLGSILENWAGLKENLRDGVAVNNDARLAFLRRVLNSVPKKRRRSVLQIGIGCPEVTRLLSRMFDEVILYDVEKGTDTVAESLFKRDRMWRLRSHVAGVRSDIVSIATRWGAHVGSCEPFATLSHKQLSTRTFDCIYLTEEPHCDLIVRHLTPILTNVEDRCWLVGSGYGHAIAPATTVAIEILLRSPERRDAQGGWALEWSKTRDGLSLFGDIPIQRGSDSCGLVLWLYDAADARRALLALGFVRDEWKGSIAVMNWGHDLPALRMACIHHKCAYIPVGTSSVGGLEARLRESTSRNPHSTPLAAAALLSIGYTPYSRTVFATLSANMPNVHNLLDSLGSRVPVVILDGDESFPIFAYDVTHCNFQSWYGRVRQWASRVKHSDLPSLIGRFRNSITTVVAHSPTSTRAVDLKRDSVQLRGIKPAVWVPEDCTFLTAILEDDLDSGRYIWDVLKGKTPLPWLVVPFGTSQAKLSSNIPPHCTIVSSQAALTKKLPNESYWTWAIFEVIRSVKTMWLLYADPLLTAQPGAELFCQESQAEFVYCGSGWSFFRRGNTVEKVAKIGPPAALFRTEWLIHSVEDYLGGAVELPFEVFLFLRAQAEQKHVGVVEVMNYGWGHE